ncbi:MAG: C4-dicarboxylate permease large subunit [candidate division NC10 bacterium CSP1-5]|nr:MAG: C4-dicarboxylate permease large subunit [candidate division NC10 bacterium CSP1-5]
MIWIIVGLGAFTILLGTPLFVGVGGMALALFAAAGISLTAVMLEMYRLVSSPALIALPLFAFAGSLLAESRSATRLVALSQAWFGWLPGGLAIVALTASALFTALSGGSGITILALGGLLYPMLLSDHYSDRFALGLVTTSGSLGILFPPSLPLIVYGLVSQARIDHLFIAGILPGLLLMLLLALYASIVGARARLPQRPWDPRVAWTTLWEAKWEILLLPLILIGIYGGFFTAGEVAAIVAAYVLVVEVFIYRDLSLTRDVPRIMVESTVLVGGILIILGTALGLTSFLIDQQVPMRLLGMFEQTITSRTVFLILLNLFLLVVGCLMDILSATIVFVPLILPVAKVFDVDPIHLGIIFLANLEIGYSTPPIGVNLFLSSLRFNKPIITLYRASVPFLVIYLIALMIITYVPDLSLILLR